MIKYYPLTHISFQKTITLNYYTRKSMMIFVYCLRDLYGLSRELVIETMI